MNTDPKELKNKISTLHEVPCFDPLKDDLTDIIIKLKSI
jgi:hypothetical protein